MADFLCHIIRRQVKLTGMRLNYLDGICENSALKLLEACSSLDKLDSIHLNSNKSWFESEAIVEKVCELFANCNKLKNTELASHMSSDASRKMITAIRTSPSHQTFDSLYLSYWNWDDDAAVEELANLLATAPNMSYTYLYNQQGKESIQAEISAAFVKVKRAGSLISQVERSNDKNIRCYT